MQTLSLFFWYVRLRIDVSRYLKYTCQMATFILEVLPGFTGLIFLGHLHGQKYIDAAALGNMVIPQCVFSALLFSCTLCTLKLMHAHAYITRTLAENAVQ